MIIYECIVVNSVLYVNELVVLIVYSCLKTTTKNIIIYARIIAVLTSKKKDCISRRDTNILIVSFVHQNQT